MTQIFKMGGALGFCWTTVEKISTWAYLPAVPLANIFSFLEKNDLSRCCLVCSRFNTIASSIFVMEIMVFLTFWCETECPPGMTWKEHYTGLYRVWGQIPKTVMPI